MKQFLLTPAAGKRLIGKAVAAHPAVVDRLKSGTVVILAGSTNGYVAEEILSLIDQSEGFSRQGFVRGVTRSPATDASAAPEKTEFLGDVVITDGTWHKGKTIFDVVENLEEGDIILKGANALDWQTGLAAVYIGHPQGGTIGVAMQAAAGRRVRIMLPVGLEKRVSADLMELAARLNAPGVSGPRLWPVPGEVVTEIDAIELLTGASAELVAGGGVSGAEGSIWLLIEGSDDEVKAASELLQEVRAEPACCL